MKSKDLMTNNNTDEYKVFVGAKKNYVNQWTCETLEKAEMSIALFKQENSKLNRNFAIILDGNYKTLKEIEL